jgi:hypothetical protein
MSSKPVRTIIMLRPEETPYGTVYHAANVLAENLTALMGRSTIREDELCKVEALGYEIIMQDGQRIAIPFPKGYKRAQPEPMHVKDEA